MNLRKIVNFIFELGHLRYVPRSGWFHLRMRDPQNDAEHSARAGQIAFILAVMEDHPDPYRVATMALFHEIAEIRTGDPNNITKQYVTANEDRAVFEQTHFLERVGEMIRVLWRECEKHETEAGKIAKDADRLELMFTAKEYEETGFIGASLWFEKAKKKLLTESAKTLAREMEDVPPSEWSVRIKKRVK